MMRRVFGFTLVELTLIVGIIGILAAISFSYLNPLELQKKARDAVRLRDVTTVKTALVSALQNGAFFSGRCLPAAPCTSLNASLLSDGSGWVDLNLTGYLTQLPRDPLNNNGTYKDSQGNTVAAAYEFAEQNGDFEIRVHLESTSNVGKYTDDGGDDPGYYEVGTKLDLL